MSGFVDECRKEWNRLGVPEAVSAEMAADLAADLAEAEAEGVSPEEVLGNGVFDPKSFAASWANARGLVGQHSVEWVRTQWARVGLALGAVVSLVVALAGLVLVTGRRSTGVAVASAFQKPIHVPMGSPRRFFIVPRLPGRLILDGSNPVVLGLVLLALGLAGLAVTLWFWRPWSTWRHRSGFDDSVGLPSYL